MKRNVTLFKALADPTRLRIVVLLSKVSELCVCQIVDVLRLPQGKVSRHLFVLRSAGVVTVRREGSWMIYSRRSDPDALERCVFDCFATCLDREPILADDIKRLAKVKRQRSRCK